MNYSNSEIFKGIDLSDSFVLFWKNEDDKLVFELEASIWSESSYYEKPKEDEHTCYKKARLEFKKIISIQGLLEMHQVNPSIDRNGDIDYGNIDELHLEDTSFKLNGDFGNVTIIGGELSFEINET